MQSKAKDPYASIAKVYDRITARFLHTPRQRLISTLQSFHISTLLDLGCGTGKFLQMLAKEGIAGIGTDISQSMLMQAKHNNDISAKPTCHSKQHAINLLVQASGHSLPLAEHALDAVVCSLVLHESDSAPDLLLQESLRVAPLVFVLEWRMPTRNLDYLLSFWVHVVERLAGKNHYAHFRNFMKAGGINGLAYRNNCHIVYEESLKYRSLALAVLKKKA